MNAPAKIEASSLHSAMALAFGEIESATKSANNPHFKSKYADLTAVIEAIKPALSKHGLFFTQHPIPHDRGVQLETFLHHASGESISLGVLFVPASKQDAQGFGSAMTYCRRYGLQTAFGLPTEDDDGNAAAKAPKEVEAPATVDATQWGIIADLIEKTGTDIQAFCAAYKIESLKALPSGQFDRARNQLNTKLQKLAKKETENA